MRVGGHVVGDAADGEAVGGEAGVLHAIGLLRDEVGRNLARLGASSCGALDRSHIVRRASA